MCRGPFEVVDMCNAMGIEAVVTTFAVGNKPGGGPVTPDDMADLVEYSFGNASTDWGRLRIEEDGHPAPYNWSYVELGNVCMTYLYLQYLSTQISQRYCMWYAGMLVLLQEQKNPSFAAQVAAMEARATSLGLPAGKFKYLYPTAAVDANVSAEAAKLGLGEQLVYDEHTGWGGGVAKFHSMLESNLTGPQGWAAINLESKF